MQRTLSRGWGAFVQKRHRHILAGFVASAEEFLGATFGVKNISKSLAVAVAVGEVVYEMQ